MIYFDFYVIIKLMSEFMQIGFCIDHNEITGTECAPADDSAERPVMGYETRAEAINAYASAKAPDGIQDGQLAADNERRRWHYLQNALDCYSQCSQKNSYAELVQRNNPRDAAEILRVRKLGRDFLDEGHREYLKYFQVDNPDADELDELEVIDKAGYSAGLFWNKYVGSANKKARVRLRSFLRGRLE